MTFSYENLFFGNNKGTYILELDNIHKKQGGIPPTRLLNGSEPVISLPHSARQQQPCPENGTQSSPHYFVTFGCNNGYTI